MKFFTVVLAVLIISVGVFIMKPNAFAADNQEVSITLSTTAQTLISVSVDPAEIDFGSMPYGSTKSTIPTDLNQTLTVSNDGNVAEDFKIKAIAPSGWTTDDSKPGRNKYVQKFCLASCTSSSNFHPINTGWRDLIKNVAVDGTQTFDLQLTAPTLSDYSGQRNVNITVLASQH